MLLRLLLVLGKPLLRLSLFLLGLVRLALGGSAGLNGDRSEGGQGEEGGKRAGNEFIHKLSAK